MNRLYPYIAAILSMATVLASAQDEHRWEPLGTCSFSDAVASDIFSDIEITTYDVKVEQDALNPGYYRIVDPYGKSNPHDFSDFLIGEGFGIVIDARNAQNVIVEHSQPGLKIQDEALYLYSLSWLEAKGEFPSEAIDANGLRGTLKDNCIRFEGAGALWASYPSFDKKDLGFSLNQSGKFCLDLTPKAGISAVETDKGEAVYYNLQGIEIAQPEPGKLVICRRGTKVEKIIAR